MLLAHVWEVAGTKNPSIAAATLRAGYNWPGFLGEYKFSKSGAVVDRPVFIKQIKNGKVVSPDDPSSEAKLH